MPSRFESLVDLQERSCERYAYNDLFGTKVEGRYRYITYLQFAQLVNELRAGLASLGVRRGDKVAIVSDNRVEWAVAAFASFGLGAPVVPMYEAQHPEDWRYILRDSDARIVLTATRALDERIRAIAGELPQEPQVVCFEGPSGVTDTYRHLLDVGRDRPMPSVAPGSDEVATVLYTSGTTGRPKGVRLSHGNIVSNVNAVALLFPINERDVSCSFLPWAHSFGQTCELHCLLSRGAAIGIARSVQTLMDDLLEIRPTLLFAVPRVFNRIYDGIQRKLAEAGPVAARVFRHGLRVSGRRRQVLEEGRRSLWLEVEHALVDRLVFAPIKDRFGGRLRYCFSGGAALSREVAELIDDLGILVFEGYGLTETSPIATANTPDSRRLGTVGKPIPGVDVFICDSDGNVLGPNVEGEVVVAGPNVMLGYHGLPEETARVIFEIDGLRAFRTGDLGRKTFDGFVTITGRLKEQYKLENGKYVVPTPVEDQLALSPFIEQVFVHGDNRPYNVCLVVPDFGALARWAAEQGISDVRPESLAADPRAHVLVGREIVRHSAGLKHYEVPRRWALLTERFSIDNDLLTPKQSLKRAKIAARHRVVLEGLYEKTTRAESTVQRMSR
jgi:long-chain acyl-CoA synthetase